MSPRLLRLYRATRYEAGGRCCRIGRRSPSLDDLLRAFGARVGVFVGAGNPGSRRIGDAANARRHACLGALVARHRCVSGWGTLGSWAEPHWFVCADRRIALRLAARFGQLAVVEVRRGRPARLVVLGVAG